MNLAASIALQFGGPGSGCNPAVGKCGRPPGGNADLQAHIDSFRPAFASGLAMLKNAVGARGEVQGRLKSAESLQEKIGRKRQALDDVTDIVGLRATVGNLADLHAVVNSIRSQFNVTEEDNRVDTPRPGDYYRAFHIGANIDGKPVEIQVRTQNESKLASWAHNLVYKGAMKFSSVATGYAQQVSTALYNMDRGLRAVLPDCPAELVAHCFSL